LADFKNFFTTASSGKFSIKWSLPGKMEFETSCRRLAKVVPPPGEWRMLMICVIYAMTLAESPEGATAVAFTNA